MDEFESINSRIPDLSAALAARIAARKGLDSTPTPVGQLDPYQMMLKKKQGETSDIDTSTIQKWPETDVKKLEDYCSKVGIVGFNCGKMPPLVALAMLKKQFGDFAGVPLEERVPEGHEKMGTPSGYGPNFPYSQAMHKKQILHG